MISRYFSLQEAVASHTAYVKGIPNVPTPYVEGTIIQTAGRMDRIREFLGHPIIISSWFRCPELCLAIGSRITSQHTKGEAVDWICPGYGSVDMVAKALASRVVYFEIDQLILEKKGQNAWIHTSFAISPPRVPRYQVLSLLQSGQYAIGLTDPFGKALV